MKLKNSKTIDVEYKIILHTNELNTSHLENISKRNLVLSFIFITTLCVLVTRDRSFVSDYQNVPF